MAKGLNRFPKSTRLHLRKEINDLFTSGKTIHAAPLRAVYKFFPPPGSPVQVVMAVPKRNLKHAVDRNRVKRQLREAFRLNNHLLTDHLLKTEKRVQLMILYNGKASPDYAIIETKIILILQRLLKLTDELDPL